MPFSIKYPLIIVLLLALFIPAAVAQEGSPDGLIVFSSARYGNRDLYVINPDGSDERQLRNDF